MIGRGCGCGVNRSGLGEPVVLRSGGEDLLFELRGEEGRLALEALAESAASAAVSRLGGDPASLGFRRHEPTEDESGAPRVEGGLAGCDDAIAVVEVVLLEVFGAHGGRMRRAGRGDAAVQVAAEDGGSSSCGSYAASAQFDPRTWAN